MKSENHLILAPIRIALLSFCFATSSIGENSTWTHQDPSVDQDIVYSEDEVDVRAKILNLRDLMRLGPSPDCRNEAEVKLSMILRKSGEVTDVRVIKSAKCSLDSKATKSVKKANFTPAQKNGVAVSQLSSISFKQYLR